MISLYSIPKGKLAIIGTIFIFLMLHLLHWYVHHFSASDELPHIPDKLAKAGTPCNDYKGYCDVFHHCREVKHNVPHSLTEGIVTWP